VKRLLRGVGRNSGRRGSLRTDTHWQSLLAGDLVPEQLQEHVRHPYAVWRQAAERVRALGLSLGDNARERRDAVKRLETVPGVGPIVALTAIAVFAEVSRFESAKHAASYAGLVPSTFQSGERDAHGHITKRGSAELRAMLCEAAHHARRSAHSALRQGLRATRLQDRGDRRGSSAVPHLVRHVARRHRLQRDSRGRRTGRLRTHHDLQVSAPAETSQPLTCDRLKDSAIPLDAIIV